MSARGSKLGRVLGDGVCLHLMVFSHNLWALFSNEHARQQADRICRRCAMHRIDDAKHFEFVCPHMHFIRDAWP